MTTLADALAPLIALAIFVATLAVVLSDRVHRVIAAAAGAAAMMVAGHVLGFYSDEQAIDAIDFETIGLLLGMIVLVRMLERTGVFEYVAVMSARRSGGSPWRLLLLLGTATTLLSMVLDNVTTVVLIAPVTVLITEILGLSPVPFLVAEAILANTGGTATLVGDPPNVLIGTTAGLSFLSFLARLGPIVLAAWVAATALLLWLYRSDLRRRSVGAAALDVLNPDETIRDTVGLRRLLAVLCATIGFFLVQDALGISPAMVALTGAAVALAWTRPDVTEILERVEWGVLVFFAALFVIVGGMNAAGLLDASAIAPRLDGVPPLLVGLVLMWVVALLSAVIDNIPITIAMLPVVTQLSAAAGAGNALWWALALGAGLGGNGTLIGSSANIVVASISERTRAPVTSRHWARRGLPIMLATLAVASVLYAVLFGWMQGP